MTNKLGEVNRVRSARQALSRALPLTQLLREGQGRSLIRGPMLLHSSRVQRGGAAEISRDWGPRSAWVRNPLPCR